MTTPVSGSRRPDPLAAIHARLADAVDMLSSSDAWQAMLTVATRFHCYSPNNVMLIAAQRPDATRIAGYRTWTYLGRQVRAGERGISILAPILCRVDPPEATPATAPPAQPEGPPTMTLAGYRATHVFDISQTDGPALPEVRPTQLTGTAPLTLWAGLLEQVEAAGYHLRYGDLAPANGLTDFTEGTVTLHHDLPAAQQVKTLTHELAHVRLHGPTDRPAGCSRARAEVEAESVAFVVTATHGLDTASYTVPYVTGWADGDRELLAETANRVITCARAILTPTEEPPTTTPAPRTRATDRHRQSSHIEAGRTSVAPSRSHGR